jgi:hypothetical protein
LTNNTSLWQHNLHNSTQPSTPCFLQQQKQQQQQKKQNLSSKHSIYPNCRAPKTEKRKHFNQQTKSGPAAKCTTATAAAVNNTSAEMGTENYPKTLNPKP